MLGVGLYNLGRLSEGTSSTPFLAFSKGGRVLASAQMEHAQIFQEGEGKVGWHEHDPNEMWTRVVASSQMEHAQIFSEGEEGKVRWHEHDPIEIRNNSVVACVDGVVGLLKK